MKRLLFALIAAAALGGSASAVDLKIDINQRAAAANTPANTQGGFLPMTINPALTGALGPDAVTTSSFGAQTVSIRGTGSNLTAFDDRRRTQPVNAGEFTQAPLLQDFIFALFNASLNPDAGLDITITGLEAGKEYAITVWSYDQSSPGNRVSDWSVSNGGTAEDYSFDGRVLPSDNSQYQVNLTGFADPTGTLVITARRDPASKDQTGVNQHGVFLNGFWIRDLFRDTDNDGMPDGWETTYGLNPNVNDAALDPDRDGLANLAEFLAETNPQNPDSDGDTLPDGAENKSGVWTGLTSTGTNPLVADSDGDGLGDGRENPDLPWTGPTQPGTDPNRYDTDTDGFGDGTEVNWPSHPRDLAVFPNPASGATLGVEFDDVIPATQPGFQTLPGSGTISSTELTGTFGPHTVTVTAVGSTFLQSRDRLAAAGGGDFNGLFRDFLFATTSADEGDGLDVRITGLAPLTSYPVTLWMWDPTSATVARRSTWLASDGGNGTTVKVPSYSLEGTNPPTSLGERQVKFTATTDADGVLLIEGRKEEGYFAAAATVNVFLNAFLIGPPQAPAVPIAITSLGPVTPQGMTLAWSSEAGRFYRLEASPDLGQWTLIDGAIPGLSGTTTFTDTTAPAGTLKRFYRVSRAP